MNIENLLNTITYFSRIFVLQHNHNGSKLALAFDNSHLVDSYNMCSGSDVPLYLSKGTKCYYHALLFKFLNKRFVSTTKRTNNKII